MQAMRSLKKNGRRNIRHWKQANGPTKISDWASGTFPPYRLGERTHIRGPSRDADVENSFREAVPSEEFVRDLCRDARDLVIGCAIHLCSPSCYKYHSKGTSHICRHQFYHVVNFATWDDNPENQKEARFRRRGKPLRACVAIIRETTYGMAGRLFTYQLHPWECSTNYAAMVAMRCNLDVQDLRRAVRPDIWMASEDQEPEPITDYASMHGAYPQRVKNFSLGTQENWGWMQHLATTTDASEHFFVDQDWKQIFKELLEVKETPDSYGLDEIKENIFKACRKAAHDAFVDNHNTGYYINAYTTKLNPTTDNLLKNFLESIRRLRCEWDKFWEAKKSEDHPSTGADHYRRTVQVLSRFESTWRRSSWKSGCEMAFPILFGHLSFTTHRCWTVYMRKAIYLAAESWRMHYGHLATGTEAIPDQPLKFILPSTQETVTLEGWHSEIRKDDDIGDYTVYINPQGETFDSLQYAYEASTKASWSNAQKNVALNALCKLHKEYQQGYKPEIQEAPLDTVTLAAMHGGKSTGFSSLSQLDDYLHRGTHPLLKHMSLYIYSMWVYRAEKSPFTTRTKQCHVEISFDYNYSASKT